MCGCRVRALCSEEFGAASIRGAGNERPYWAALSAGDAKDSCVTFAAAYRFFAPLAGALRFALTLIVAAAVCCQWPAGAAAGPFDGRGMWIWYVSHSDGGDYQSIAARANANGIRTLFIKSGDGSVYWQQFNRSLVDALHAQGIAACAWQFVYGNDPLSEAAVGAEAVRNGADCLVIDAEAAYEGRYASARAYIDALRSDVGADYPLGLASFPYVDEHPDFPYSVFLGPGGANYNLPQMYWRDIGTSVPQVYAHTYAVNIIYRRPIRPLGQVTCCADAQEAQQFRGLSVAYNAGGLSWWDYAWSSARGMWRRSATSTRPPPPPPPPGQFSATATPATWSCGCRSCSEAPFRTRSSMAPSARTH